MCLKIDPSVSKISLPLQQEIYSHISCPIVVNNPNPLDKSSQIYRTKYQHSISKRLVLQNKSVACCQKRKFPISRTTADSSGLPDTTIRNCANGVFYTSCSHCNRLQLTVAV